MRLPRTNMADLEPPLEDAATLALTPGLDMENSRMTFVIVRPPSIPKLFSRLLRLAVRLAPSRIRTFAPAAQLWCNFSPMAFTRHRSEPPF